MTMSNSTNKDQGFEANHLTKKYKKENQNTFALQDVSCLFPERGLNIILGPSGCGKTTLLNIMAGLEVPDEGAILFEGKPIYVNHSKINYVTVESACIPSLSLRDNLLLVTKNEKKINDVLSLLNLQELSKKKVSLLSRGEQSRLALAISLFLPSKALLFDEPTANLDSANAENVFSVLSQLSVEKTVIVATHDESMARKFGTKIFRLQEGRLSSVEDGHPEERKDLSLPESQERKGVPFIPYAKLAVRKSFSHIPSLIASSVLLCLSFFFLFLSLSFGMIDRGETLHSTIAALPTPYIQVDDNTIDSNRSPSEQTRGYGLRAISLFLTPSYNHGAISSGKSGYELTFDDQIRDFLPNIDNLLKLPDSFKSTEEIHYCPLAVSEQTLERVKWNSDNSYQFQIGDVLPFTLMQNCKPIHTDFQFVLTGILPFSSDASITPFPSVMRKEDYDLFLKREGIISSTLRNTLADVINEYNDYCQSNGLTPTEDHLIERTSIAFRLYRIVTKSMLSNQWISANSLDGLHSPIDGAVYYEGEFPDTDDWIMIPSTSVSQETYEALKFSYEEEDREDKDFFSSYLDEKDQVYYPLENGFGNMGLSDVDCFCLSGIYRWTRAEEKDDFDQYIVVSDSLWNRLYHSAIDELRDDRIKPQEYWMKKESLYENYDKYLHGELTFRSDTYLMNSQIAFSNVEKSSQFYFYLSVAVFVVSLIVNSLYGMNVVRSLRYDYAVLTLFGRKKKDFFLIALLSFLPTTLIALFVTLCIAQVSTSAIFTSSIQQVGFAGVLCTPFGYAYLAVLLCVVFLLLVNSLLSLVFSHQKTISILKEKD